MNTIFRNTTKPLFLLIVLLTLSACSTVDSYRNSGQPTSASLPKIPEIKSPRVLKPGYTAPKKAVIPAPRAQIKSSSFQIKNTPVVTNSRSSQPTQQQIETQRRLISQAKQQAKIQAKKDATVDIDPYASIPESSSNNPRISSTVTIPKMDQNSEISGLSSTKSSSPTMSPAVRTLMISARADIALGKGRSAMSKLERGLRIEPQNAELWHMLAKAHYSNSAYLHSISIAKKSNANTNDRDLINQNWELIKQAGKRSGNASAIKEALDYMKLNP